MFLDLQYYSTHWCMRVGKKTTMRSCVHSQEHTGGLYTFVIMQVQHRTNHCSGLGGSGSRDTAANCNDEVRCVSKHIEPSNSQGRRRRCRMCCSWGLHRPGSFLVSKTVLCFIIRKYILSLKWFSVCVCVWGWGIKTFFKLYLRWFDCL